MDTCPNTLRAFDYYPKVLDNHDNISQFINLHNLKYIDKRISFSRFYCRISPKSQNRIPEVARKVRQHQEEIHNLNQKADCLTNESKR